MSHIRSLPPSPVSQSLPTLPSLCSYLLHGLIGSRKDVGLTGVKLSLDTANDPVAHIAVSSGVTPAALISVRRSRGSMTGNFSALMRSTCRSSIQSRPVPRSQIDLSILSISALGAEP